MSTVNDRQSQMGEVEILSFLVAGHTKFSPDGCFGLFKRRYRQGRVGCLDDTVRVVASSAEVNTAQLVGAQDGTVVVPTVRQGLVSSSVTVCHYIIP